MQKIMIYKFYKIMMSIIQQFITRSKLSRVFKKEDDKVSFEFTERDATFIVSIPDNDVKRFVKQYIRLHGNNERNQN